MGLNLYTDLPAVASINQTSEILGCHPDLIRRMIKSGELPHIRVGRLYKIPRHALVGFLTQNDDPAVSGEAAPSDRATPGNDHGEE